MKYLTFAYALSTAVALDLSSMVSVNNQNEANSAVKTMLVGNLGNSNAFGPEALTPSVHDQLAQSSALYHFAADAPLYDLRTDELENLKTNGLTIYEGRQVRIQVAENASTGQKWSLNEHAAAEYFSSTTAYIDESPEGVLGAPGYREFTLTATNVGEAEFRIGLSRPDFNGLIGLEIAFDVSVIPAP